MPRPSLSLEPGFRSAAALLSAVLLALPASAQLSKLPGANAADRDRSGLPLGLVEAELAGRSLGEYPGFTFTQAFYEGTPVEVGVDLARHPDVGPGSYALFVTRHKAVEEWSAKSELVDERGAPQLVVLTNGTLAGNAVAIDVGTLSGEAGTGFGVGYDVVLDVDGDSRLSSGDLIDGLGPVAGFYVVRDPADFGPLAVTETSYFVTGVKAGFEGQNTFYPTNVGSLGELPLVVVSHGNGHDYNWYNNIGVHLASWGFVVMSHENDTGPGIDNASNTTLDHTDAFLGSLDTIDGGVLDGHVDGDTIIWIGHSRGGRESCAPTTSCTTGRTSRRTTT